MSWDLVCEFERVKDKMIHEDSLLKIVNYSFYGGGGLFYPDFLRIAFTKKNLP